MRTAFISNAYLAVLLCGAQAMAQPPRILATKFLKTEREIHVQGLDRLLVRESEILLIADESGKALGSDGLRESAFRKLKKFEAEIHDIGGKRLAALKKRDIQQSTVSYSAIYDEHKTRFYHLSYPKLPYIITRTKEYKLNSAFFWPDWDPQRMAPVDEATLTVISHPNLPFEFRHVGDIEPPQITADADGRQSHSWRVTNVPAYLREFREAPEASFEIGLKFKPKRFNLDGFVGENEDWRSFGQWAHRLFADRISLESRPPILAEVEKISEPLEKIRTLYRYLQKETRYVQIYLGIDGWRPHHVEDVHRSLYGDCKDLSVYFIALLRKAGIPAWPALALTRDAGWVDADFPGNQFNHCIAVVPMESDTLWVECTSDVNAVNDLPQNIEGINALLVTPDGGALIRSPESSAEANRGRFSAVAILDHDRSLQIQGKAEWTGNLAINLRRELKGLSLPEQEKWLKRRLSSSSSEISVSGLEFDGLNEPDSPLSLNLEAKLAFFARKAGSRFIFQPRFFHRIIFDGETPDERSKPLLNPTRFVFDDSIKFVLPEEFCASVDAKSDSIKSEFGGFNSQIIPASEGAVWKSRYDLRTRNVALDKYEEYYHFMKEVKAKAETKIVLQKNQ